MAKKKPADIRIYTDGSYYQHSSALGCAWIRATKGEEDKKRGYCIKSPDNNKGGSLLAEILAVSEGLRQLGKDVGSCKVTIYTDCQIIRDTAYNKEFGYRAQNSKLEVLADAWEELGEEIGKHDADVVWAREENEPKLAEAHKMAQTSANYKIKTKEKMVHTDDIAMLDLCAPQ